MKVIVRGVLQPYIIGTFKLDGSDDPQWEMMPGGPCEIETDVETGDGVVRLLADARPATPGEMRETVVAKFTEALGGLL